MTTWFSEFANAVGDDTATYLRCESCDAVGLPPPRTLAGCDDDAVVETPLPSKAAVVSFTEIASTIPKFSDETPYTVVIGEFDGCVRLTGQLRGSTEVEIDDEIEPGIETVGEDNQILTFTPM